MQAAPDPPVVRVRGLVKTYGAHPAVDGIDLDIFAGEIFALLGPNGAGKTTTVEILEGFRSRDAGEVTVLGHDPAERDRAWRARVGIVLQSTGEAGEITVAELVHHFAGFYPASRDPDEVIEAVGLTEQRGKRAGALSGGQRRRLDVALGIVGRPELLFLDEPTTGFDPQARRAFWELLSSLRAEGTTMLLTTHYLDEAQHLADRVGVIAGGHLLEVNPVDQLGGEERRTPIVRWREDGALHEDRTADPTSAVVALAGRFPDGIADLEVRRPSLEDIYLSMIEQSRPNKAELTEVDR
ncbi:MAG: ABC transporter ATP-binding protein [Actinomycetota bacterium]|nr:ABC transporter ATP-binding protein [Actinomycetota bacterium]